jgi:two-component system, OmpR family, phosphate regulon sensor histidine kinase PhoR
MKFDLIGKVAGAWLVLLLCVPAAMFWVAPDLETHQQLPAAVKLTILIGLVGGIALLPLLLIGRDWVRSARHFEEYISALPFQEKDLPGTGSPEMQDLSISLSGMAGRVRNVVEEANIETARRETILACMAEGVLAVDSELKVVFCNNAFAKSFGTRLPLEQGRALYEVVREPVLRDILQRVVGTGETQSDRFQLPSAAGRWFEARALPFGPMQRRSAVIVLHDVTDIHRQEQLRKDFVADVSHELRTPLAAIRGYAETLLDGGLEDISHNRRFVEIIHAHAIRLNNIASDLLVLSSLDSEENAPLPVSRVEMLEVIQSAINTVTVAAEAKNISIETADCYPCAVSVVRFRLEQVVVNLLDNAVKFNRDNGTVRIACQIEASQKSVLLEVSDTGIGIPSGDLARVFERFYRVDRARSRPAGGTGLGLPIVKETITRMGGTVAVESQLGRGSKFVINLPAA